MAPDNNLLKFSYPTAKLIERPTELQRENLPPTQSFIEKTIFWLIPNFLISVRFVETAAKCFETALTFNLETSQSLIVLALEMVSWVVKVLETITNKVVSGFKSLMISKTWSPSTLETKWGFNLDE